MKKSFIRTIIIGIFSGFSCLLDPSGSYGGTPAAIYQQPFNIAVFYLIYFAIQSDFLYEHSMYDVRCKTVFRAKLLCFLRMELFSALFIFVYFLASCAVSYILVPESVSLLFSPFSVTVWVISAAADLSILNILSVNLNYLIKKNTIIFTQAAIILSGLAMCFAAPNVVPYLSVWFYGVYPKPAISPAVSLPAYLIWTGIAVCIGFIPIKEIIREKRQ